MNWKCIFDHNWGKVRSISEESAINNLLEERFRKYAISGMKTSKAFLRGHVPPDHIGRKLCQYICTRPGCCAVKDDIKKFLDDCRKKGSEKLKWEQVEIRATEKAEAKLKGCAKDKLIKINLRKRRN